MAGLLLLAGAIAKESTLPKKAPPFRAADYPISEFQVTQSTHTFGDFNIRIIHAKRRKGSATAPSYCRAWVEISRDQKLLRRVYYADFEPVGYKYGVFVPKTQPDADYFALVKEGDYDGRLLLLSRSGAVTNTLGGSYFVIKGQFLVSGYSSDEAGLAVFDLQTGKVVLQTTDIPYIQRWYKDSVGYFFTESEWSQGSGEAHERVGVAYRLDLDKRKIRQIDMRSFELRAAKSVAYDFDPRRYDDCISK